MSRSASDDRVSAPGPWWMETRFVLGASAVGLIVVLGVAIALGVGGHAGSAPSGSGAGQAARRPAVARARSAVARGGAPGGGCSLPAGDQSVPTATPVGTRWVLVGLMAAPSAPATIGPQHTRDGFRVCFADSPLGALYAMVNFWASATAFAPAVVYEHLAARTSVLGQAVHDATVNPSSIDTPAETVQIAGFSFVSYTRMSATISVVFAASAPDGAGALVQFPGTMVWEGGDWRYVIPPGGNPGGGQLSSLGGYVAWSGV